MTAALLLLAFVVFIWAGIRIQMKSFESPTNRRTTWQRKL